MKISNFFVLSLAMVMLAMSSLNAVFVPLQTEAVAVTDQNVCWLKIPNADGTGDSGEGALVQVADPAQPVGINVVWRQSGRHGAWEEVSLVNCKFVQLMSHGGVLDVPVGLVQLKSNSSAVFSPAGTPVLTMQNGGTTLLFALADVRRADEATVAGNYKKLYGVSAWDRGDQPFKGLRNPNPQRLMDVAGAVARRVDPHYGQQPAGPSGDGGQGSSSRPQTYNPGDDSWDMDQRAADVRADERVEALRKLCEAELLRLHTEKQLLLAEKQDLLTERQLRQTLANQQVLALQAEITALQAALQAQTLQAQAQQQPVYQQPPQQPQWPTPAQSQPVPQVQQWPQVQLPQQQQVSVTESSRWQAANGFTYRALSNGAHEFWDVSSNTWRPVQ